MQALSERNAEAFDLWYKLRESADKDLAAASFAAWCLRYFRTTYLTHPRTGQFIQWGLCHWDLVFALEALAERRAYNGVFCTITLDDQNLVVAMPRGWAKSTIATLMWPLWLIYTRRRNVFLIASNTETQVKAFVRDLKREIETNLKLLNDYGAIKGTKWDETQFNTTSGAHVVGVGTTQSIRGVRVGEFRPEVAIIDDPEDDIHVISENQREKVKHWLRSVVINTMVEGVGQVVILGTTLHTDALVSVLMNIGEVQPDPYPGWARMRVRALYEDADGNVYSSWPWMWPVELLLRRRRIIGEAAWFAEFQMDPRKLGQLITGEQIKLALQNGAWLQLARMPSEFERTGYDTVIQGVDPSFVADKKAAEKADSDYFVTITLAIKIIQLPGQEPQPRFDVVGLYRDRGMPTPEQMKQLEWQEVIFRPDEIAVENNAAQIMLQQGIEAQASSRIVGHTTRFNNKWEAIRGLPGLQVAFEKGWFAFPAYGESREQIEPLIHELFHLGRTKHDDCVMALWIAFTRALDFWYDWRARHIYDELVLQATQERDERRHARNAQGFRDRPT